MGARAKPIVLTAEQIEEYKKKYCIEPIRRTVARAGDVLATVQTGPSVAHSNHNYVRYSHMTDAQVIEVRRRASAGDSAGVIAVEMGLPAQGVYKAAIGMTFRHLPGAIPYFASTRVLKTARRPGTGEQRRTYSEEDVEKMHQAFTKGMTLTEISVRLSIPLSTLKHRFSWWQARQKENARLALVQGK